MFRHVQNIEYNTLRRLLVNFHTLWIYQRVSKQAISTKKLVCLSAKPSGGGDNLFKLRVPLVGIFFEYWHSNHSEYPQTSLAYMFGGSGGDQVSHNTFLMLLHNSRGSSRPRPGLTDNAGMGLHPSWWRQIQITFSATASDTRVAYSLLT